MEPTQNRRERNKQEFLAVIVTDMHCPLTPILREVGREQRLDDLKGAAASVDQIFKLAASPVGKYFLRACTVKKEDSHSAPPSFAGVHEGARLSADVNQPDVSRPLTVPSAQAKQH